MKIEKYWKTKPTWYVLQHEASGRSEIQFSKLEQTQTHSDFATGEQPVSLLISSDTGMFGPQLFNLWCQSAIMDLSTTAVHSYSE